MATNNSQYRYNTNYGIRTGFTDNQGYNIGITPIVFTAAGGTTSMSGTFSVNTSNSFTYVNLVGPLTGNSYVNVNATYSYIGDQLCIMAQGSATATYSLTLDGNISSQVLSIGTGKTAYFTGQFNGTEFIGTGTVQS